MALAERAGPGGFVLATRAGLVLVLVLVHVDEALRATLTSVPTHLSPVAPADLAEALAALDWPHSELGLAGPGAVLTLRQGEDMGRPSLLTVTLPEGDARVRVAGSAARIG